MVLIKLTNDVADDKAGSIVDYSNSSAKDIIEAGYGMLIEPKEKKKFKVGSKQKTNTKEKPQILSDKISIITDHSEIIKTICPAFGMLKDKDSSHYYFGANITCKVPIKYNGKVNYKQEKFLVLIKDNRTYTICHNQNLIDYNFELDGNLLLNKPRWDVKNMYNWLSDENYTPKIESLTPKELFNNIKKELEYYLDIPEKRWYDYLTLWTIGTYFFSFFSTYPMVYLYGLKNAGKTKIMTLCSLLSFNGSLFVGITPATLFRIIQSNRPSLFLDEVEKLLDKKREGSADIEAMLNSGYKKGATVPRCEKGKDNIFVKEYDVYCPKMFAHVNGKVSRTLISRCIRIIMERANPGNKKADRWMEEHDKKWQNLRNELYIFGLEYWNNILYYYEGTGEIEKEIKIDNRDWELWKPILVLSKLVDDDLYKIMGNFAEELVKENQKDEIDGWEYIIVKTLKDKVDTDRYYFVSEIRAWLLNEFEKEEDVPSNKSVGWELKRLGLKDHKREGNKGTKWYISKNIVDNLVLKLDIKDEKKTTQTTQTTPNKEKSGVVSVVCGLSTPIMEERCFFNNNNNNNVSIGVTPQNNCITTQTTPKNVNNTILDIIRQLSTKLDMIPLENILRTANKAQIQDFEVESAIDSLKQKGDVYCPKSGFIKLLQ